jgi:hypothetical protein
VPAATDAWPGPIKEDRVSKPSKILLNLIRLLIVVQLAIGLMTWLGGAANLVNAHIGIGLLFVVLVWAFASMSAGAGAPRGLVIVTLMWGIIAVAFGYAQTGLMPGVSHWVVRLAHILIMLGLAGQAERIAKAVKARAA